MTLFTLLVFAILHGCLSLHVNDTAAFKNVCTSPNVDAKNCTFTSHPWEIYIRLLYYAIVTFLSIGYGDIVPGTLGSTIFMLPVPFAMLLFFGAVIVRLYG